MPAHKIINDEQLLSMLSQGKSRKDVAVFFGVSVVAIGKRLKRILPSGDSILEKHNLSEKEAEFVRNKAQGLSNVQAVQSAYNVTSLQSAKSLGTTLMKKPEIKQSIEELMNCQGLSRRYRVQKLKQHVDNRDPNISLKALDQTFRLDGYKAEDTTNVNNYFLLNEVIAAIQIARDNNDNED